MGSLRRPATQRADRGAPTRTRHAAVQQATAAVAARARSRQSSGATCIALTGHGATPGCQITATATVTGTSPYPTIDLPATTVMANDSYTIQWHISKTITDTLQWQISGTEACGV